MQTLSIKDYAKLTGQHWRTVYGRVYRGTFNDEGAEIVEVKVPQKRIRVKGK